MRKSKTVTKDLNLLTTNTAPTEVTVTVDNKTSNVNDIEATTIKNGASVDEVTVTEEELMFPFDDENETSNVNDNETTTIENGASVENENEDAIKVPVIKEEDIDTTTEFGALYRIHKFGKPNEKKECARVYEEKKERKKQEEEEMLNGLRKRAIRDYIGWLVENIIYNAKDNIREQSKSIESENTPLPTASTSHMDELRKVSKLICSDTDDDENPSDEINSAFGQPTRNRESQWNAIHKEIRAKSANHGYLGDTHELSAEEIKKVKETVDNWKKAHKVIDDDAYNAYSNIRARSPYDCLSDNERPQSNQSTDTVAYDREINSYSFLRVSDLRNYGVTDAENDIPSDIENDTSDQERADDNIFEITIS